MKVYPPWLNRQEYPFGSHFVDVPAGKMHYVDEGQGEPILFLHGNPSWSFDYRKVIKALRHKYRCIAMDHIGFGLSDKPPQWDYLPQSHARNFEEFVRQLGITDFTMVVNDWGGPIGLSYAVQHPEKIKRLVLANTWMWPVNGDLYFEAFSRIMGGAIGRFLSVHFNFFAKVIGKAVFGEPQHLDPEVFRHYYAHLAHKQDRKGTWVFPKHITASGEWLQELWQQRHKITQKPVLILWGMKDLAFRERELKKWEAVLENSNTVRLEQAGHFPQEEASNQYSQALMAFMEH